MWGTLWTDATRRSRTWGPSPTSVHSGNELHKMGMGLVKTDPRARRMTVPDARARLQELVETHLCAADVPDTVERECLLVTVGGTGVADTRRCAEGAQGRSCNEQGLHVRTADRRCRNRG